VGRKVSGLSQGVLNQHSAFDHHHLKYRFALNDIDIAEGCSQIDDRRMLMAD
jgi:hypothetical protein